MNSLLCLQGINHRCEPRAAVPFERYCTRYRTSGFEVPALIPQVCLHYDPYTRRAAGTLTRQAPRTIAERWIASARREYLDRMLVMGERHPQLVLGEYADDYNTRPHRTLQKNPPADVRIRRRK